MTQPLNSSEYQPLLRTTFERLSAVAPTETGYPGSALDPATLEHDDPSRGYLRALTDLLGYLHCRVAQMLLQRGNIRYIRDVRAQRLEAGHVRYLPDQVARWLWHAWF